MSETKCIKCLYSHCPKLWRRWYRDQRL